MLRAKEISFCPALREFLDKSGLFELDRPQGFLCFGKFALSLLLLLDQFRPCFRKLLLSVNPLTPFQVCLFCLCLEGGTQFFHLQSCAGMRLLGMDTLAPLLIGLLGCCPQLLFVLLLDEQRDANSGQRVVGGNRQEIRGAKESGRRFISETVPMLENR